MAAYNSTVYAKQIARSGAFLGAQEVGSKVRRTSVTVNTTTQPLNNGDTVNLFTLPKGARIQGIYVSFGAMGASATLTLGDAGSATRYLASTSVAAAGTTDSIPETGFLYELTDDTVIVATVGGANYASAKDLKVAVDYTLE